MAVSGCNIGKTIKALREHFKMSQEDLARKGCMTLDEIKEIESGKSTPLTSFEFECIAQAFSLDQKDLESCVHNTELFFKNHLNVPTAA